MLKVYELRGNYHSPRMDKKQGPKHFDFRKGDYIEAEPKAAQLMNEQPSVIFDDRYIIPGNFLRELNPMEIEVLYNANLIKSTIDRPQQNANGPIDNANIPADQQQPATETQTSPETSAETSPEPTVFKTLGKNIKSKATNYAIGGTVAGVITFIVTKKFKLGMPFIIIATAAGAFLGAKGYDYIANKYEESKKPLVNNEPEPAPQTSEEPK